MTQIQSGEGDDDQHKAVGNSEDVLPDLQTTFAVRPLLTALTRYGKQMLQARLRGDSSRVLVDSRLTISPAARRLLGVGARGGHTQEGPDDISVRGNRQYALQIVTNLLSNAAKVSPSLLLVCDAVRCGTAQSAVVVVRLSSCGCLTFVGTAHNGEATPCTLMMRMIRTDKTAPLFLPIRQPTSTRRVEQSLSTPAWMSWCPPRTPLLVLRSTKC